MTHRRSYQTDPALLDQVLSLLETCFPGVEKHVRSVTTPPARWQDASTPFVAFDGNRPVSHVGLIEFPMVLDGVIVPVGGVHGVCTCPKARRRGWYRKLIEEVLAHAADIYETLVLYCGEPAIYEPFGFRSVPQCRFLAEVDHPGGGGGLHRLDLTRPADMDLLLRALDHRAPVSRIAGVVREYAAFLFSEVDKPLFLEPRSGTVLAHEIEGDTLKLYDVVAGEIPALTTLLGWIDRPVSRVEIYFTPDLVLPGAEPEAYQYDGGYFMVRGPFPIEGRPFAFARTAHC